MKILLFGISNVGKTSIGQILAQKLNYVFYDLDEEIKKNYKMTLTDFINVFPNDYLRHQKRCEILEKTIKKSRNSVIAVSVLNYQEQFHHILEQKDIFPIDLRDTPTNIFDRLVFSDENDIIYTDDIYKNKRRNYYINEIINDLYYYSQVYANIKSKYFIDNKSIETIANELYNLITTNTPIKIKFNYNEIKKDIFYSCNEKVCYYNMITHEKIYKKRLKHNYEIENELTLNASIYIQLPTYDDYNEFQIFRNFVNTINDQVSKEKLLQNYGLCNDYGKIIKKLNLIDEWNHFNECAFNKFVKKWCYENNIEI